jgi:hypothetical protein
MSSVYSRIILSQHQIWIECLPGWMWFVYASLRYHVVLIQLVARDLRCHLFWNN